ncbi:MAG: hypothetical protein ACYDCK_10760 [Thermoplasmatota archaeon]
MHVEHVPLLHRLAALYAQPRGMDRFRAYVAAMTGGTGDAELAPLVLANPMAREHVAARVDELIALGAERVAADAGREAEARLVQTSLALKMGLVVADDLKGGWTDRHLTEYPSRFEGTKGTLARKWASVVLWVSDVPDLARIREETLAAIYRAAHQHVFAIPRTLAEALTQEGRAARFAGATGPTLAEAELAHARDVLAKHAEASDRATMLPAMYGDAVARKVGNPPLGLPERAGFAVALVDALADARSPEAWLTRVSD